MPVLLEPDIGVKPGAEELLSGLVLDGGENRFGGRGAPFGICGTRFVPRELEIGGWDMPTPWGVGWRWGSIIGQNWFEVSKVGFWMYVSHAS